MTMEEYIRTSKLSLDELITFAKNAHLSPDVIRKLYKCRSTYKIYKTPFKKEEYLKSTSLIIDGKMVKPKAEDVDVCIEYLKANGRLLCYKTVTETISQYKSGKIDITQRPERVINESTKTQLQSLEEEQTQLEQTLERVEQLESKVTQAENKSIKIGD